MDPDPSLPAGGDLLHWYAAQAVTLTGDTIPNSLPGEIL